jgi:hypothetical protein
VGKADCAFDIGVGKEGMINSMAVKACWLDAYESFVDWNLMLGKMARKVGE